MQDESKDDDIGEWVQVSWYTSIVQYIFIVSHQGYCPLYLSHSLTTLGYNTADTSVTIYPDGSSMGDNPMCDQIRH